MGEGSHSTVRVSEQVGGTGEAVQVEAVLGPEASSVVQT
jgi:hypothetical protein